MRLLRMSTQGSGYQLSIVDDEGQTTTVPMVREDLTIGRKEGNVIRLTERNVSRSHARVLRENGRFFVLDLGSYNGTRVNGRRIRGKVPLVPGDEIGVGDYILRVEKIEGVSVSVPPPVEVSRAPQVTLVVDGTPAKVYHLTDVPQVIGRGDEATIVVDDPAVSRTHARLSLLQGRYFLEDMGSDNGILVSGRAVRSKALEPGDVIDLGRVQLYFTLGALRPEDLKAAAAPRVRRSRLPMTIGLVGVAAVAVAIVVLMMGRGGGGGGGGSSAGGSVAGGAPQSGGAESVPGVEEVAVVPVRADAAEPAVGASGGAVGVTSAEEALVAVREAARKADTVDDWDEVLELLQAGPLASSHEAAEVRVLAQREKAARLALDRAQGALVRREPWEAVALLKGIAPDTRVSAEVAEAWEGVILAGRQADRHDEVDELRRIVEALREVLALPPEVAKGRAELIAALRRREPAGAGAPAATDVFVRVGSADAGPAAAPGDAGAGQRPPPPPPPLRMDAGPRPPLRDAGATAPPRDVGVAPDAGAELLPSGASAAQEAFDRAREMVVNNDHAGCINVLQRAPQTSRNMEMLISCLKAAGRMPEALDVMQRYIQRYPDARKADEYRRALESAGRAP